MGISLKRKPTISELEDEKEHLTIEEEVLTKKAEIAEREAVISELKSKYGKNWAKTLGISKFTNLSTLRSFLVSAKRGLEKQASAGGSPLSKIVSFKGLPRA